MNTPTINENCDSVNLVVKLCVFSGQISLLAARMKSGLPLDVLAIANLLRVGNELRPLIEGD